MNKVFFDLETTGVSVSKDRIVQIAAIKTDSNFNILDQKDMLLNPKMHIPAEATAVHGITNEAVAFAPEFVQISGSLLRWFEDCEIGGYNSNTFDIPLLAEEFHRCGIDWKPQHATADIFHVYRAKEKRNLAAAYALYCGKEMTNAHNALYDIQCTLECLHGMMFMYDMTWEEICDFEKADKVDLAGCVILKEGVAVWSFGKNKDKPVAADRGYCDWFMKQDFTTNSKNVVKSLCNGAIL